MDYKYYEKDNSIIIDKVKHFEPKHIFDCGQSFRWQEENDGSYTGIACKKVINISKNRESIIINNTTLEDFKNIWFSYFDLERDYGDIKNQLKKDPILSEAIKFGEGIRILRQDEWEILVSFIISANNRIPLIKRAIGKISAKWGKPIKYNGNTYFAFPDPQELSVASVSELEECGIGFRAKYIYKTTNMIINNEINLHNLKNDGYMQARCKLMSLSGVGPKVADCILLFSMGYYEAFPVDVWVKRVMQCFYLTSDVSLKMIGEYSRDKFKGLAGFAQQYLFYYARDMKGKNLV